MANESKSTNDLIFETMKQMNDIADNSIHAWENRIQDSMDKIETNVKDSATVNDAYGNSLLAIGNDDKVTPFTNYTFSNDTLNWPLWLTLYNESWVFQRAIDKPAQDEIKCGIELKGINDRENDVQRKLNLYKDDMTKLLMWGALFGGSIAVAMFDNFKQEDYEKPFDKLKVSKAKTLRFYVTDRWYGVAPDYDNIVTKMSSLDYGKPKYYTITLANGKTFRYHHDYVIRYEHRFAPQLVKQGMLQGWGYAEGAHIFNELARDEKLKTSIQSLMDKSLIEVIKMSGMRGVFMGADKTNESQLQKRLEMVNWGRNFNSLTFLDKDDEYSMNQFSGLSGLSDLLQQNMWQIAAALEMQGVLFGDLKGGFSTDQEALERYDETIQGRCESYVRPVYEKLLKYIYCMLGINQKIDFTFGSILNKKHKADKIVAINSMIDTCSKLLTDGIITTKQYAETMKRYLANETIDFDFSEENINKISENSIEESEDFDIDTETQTENTKSKSGLGNPHTRAKESLNALEKSQETNS